MPKADSSINMLIVAAVVALGIGYFVPQTFSQRMAQATGGEGKPEVATQPVTPPPAQPQAAAQTGAWAASAPGRVEPMGGEIRISGQMAGRVTDVLVGVNDRVTTGDLLLKLADEELTARVLAARAEVAVRKRDRDNENVNRSAQDRRTAEDNFANAERQLVAARSDLDRLLRDKRNGGTPSSGDVSKARETVRTSVERLEQNRVALQKALAVDTSIQTRLEAGLTAARAELTLAEAAYERARIRAPADGNILQINTKVGEIVAPSPENILVVVGDTSSLRVRAEFEERDIGKVRVGQAAVIRSDAFPGKDFIGKVSSLAQALGPTKLGQRGPRRPTDVDVLEVIIDIEGQPPMLPGMRVDVFLKAELASQPAAAAAQAGPQIKAN
jgi:HlyD family secretion protein